MRRFEYKYIAPIDVIDAFRNYILDFVEPDSYMDKLSEYTVRSIYLDTFDFQFYHDKVEGLDIRKKVRIRGYNQINGEDNLVFLEIKRKWGMSVKKDRAVVLFKDVENLLSSGNIAQYVVNGSANANKFLFHLYLKKLHPKILVIYEREAYHDARSGEIRITFDKNLRSWVYPNISDLFVEKDILYSYADNFIIEVKFYRELPRWFKFAVEKFSLKQISFSKYAVCIDTHGIITEHSKKLIKY